MDAEEDKRQEFQSEVWSESIRNIREQSEKILLFRENSYTYIQVCYLI